MTEVTAFHKEETPDDTDDQTPGWGEGAGALVTTINRGALSDGPSLDE